MVKSIGWRPLYYSAVFIDLKKVFDTVDVQILVKNFPALVFRRTLYLGSKITCITERCVPVLILLYRIVYI